MNRTVNSEPANPDVPVPPRVSVVIPAYNAATYISGTLNSVFAQTCKDFEVIVVNDGSPDIEQLEEALQPYRSRIHYLRQENCGPSSARNTPIRNARGRYLAFLDSDDLWLPQHLARQVEMLTTDPQIGLVYSNALHLEHDRPVGVAFDTVPQFGEPTFDALLAERCTVNTSSVVVLRDAVLQAGLFDENMNRCEDLELWLRLASKGMRMAYDREIQICHRLGEGLAANQILMKRGRILAYRKTAAAAGLTNSQQSIIQDKLRSLDLEIEIETARRALLAGRYTEAVSAASKANLLAQGRKLRFAVLGLRFFPGALRQIYRVYLQVLNSYKRRKRASAVKRIEIAGESLNLESVIGQHHTPGKHAASLG
ncbi:MAG TPA: glycosyltransferase family A protein [Candidatus Sulfotelmatobacter sp.]